MFMPFFGHMNYPHYQMIPNFTSAMPGGLNFGAANPLTQLLGGFLGGNLGGLFGGGLTKGEQVKSSAWKKRAQSSGNKPSTESVAKAVKEKAQDQLPVSVFNPLGWNPTISGALLGMLLGSTYMYAKRRKELKDKPLVEQLFSSPVLFGGLAGGLSGAGFGLALDQYLKFIKGV